ncbi:MAG TPA: gamma-glutamylcyclotransferase family protein [Streptosporangiaceae bacterium]|nr:gamma-glutamylcyclotransferase family protein [Streptosporangiaceae bacterium]
MPSAAGRAATMIAQRGDLFVYGTLQFPEVLHTLLGRIPEGDRVTLSGWRAAALARRPYPGLVQANATVTGTLLTGLSADELVTLDEYESGPYDLRQLSLTDGRPAWSYVWTQASAVLESDWSADEFATEHLPGFVVRVGAWLTSRAADSSSGRPAFRPHDPELAS